VQVGFVYRRKWFFGIDNYPNEPDSGGLSSHLKVLEQAAMPIKVRSDQ
jgi:hypothetical protein